MKVAGARFHKDSWGRSQITTDPTTLKLEQAADEARTMLSLRRASVQDVERVIAYAKGMNAFPRKSGLMETNAHIRSFVKESLPGSHFSSLFSLGKSEQSPYPSAASVIGVSEHVEPVPLHDPLAPELGGGEFAPRIRRLTVSG